MGDSIPFLDIKPIHPDFRAPKQATDGSAGFDLFMPEAGHIPAGGKVKVGLGFATAIPKGYVGLISPRSGVGTKQTLELANSLAVIDADYRGEWMATLRIKDGKPCSWEAQARLLQVVVVPVPQIHLRVVSELDDTERGEGGHGSTGL